MLTRRNVLSFGAGALILPFLRPAETFAAGETTALIELVTQTKSNDFSTIGPVADKARKIGWEVPTKGSQFRLLGAWKYIASNKQKGEIQFQKGGALSLGPGSALPFKNWEVRSNGKGPSLIVFNASSNALWFQYFQRSGVALISNLGNRKQWIVLTVK